MASARGAAATLLRSWCLCALIALSAAAGAAMPPPSPRAARPFLNAMATAAAARPANASRPLQQVAAAVGAILKNATTPPPPKPPLPPATAASRFVTALIGQNQPSGALLAPAIQRSLSTILDLPQVDAAAAMFGVNKTAVVDRLATDLAAAIAQSAVAGTTPAETLVTLVPVALSSMSRSMNGTAAAPLVTALAGTAQSVSPAVVVALMQGFGQLLTPQLQG